MSAATAVVTVSQAAFCWITCTAASPPVAVFYKSLTTLNIFAMSLVTFPMVLLRVMPVPPGTVWRDHPQAYTLFDGVYPTAASYVFLSLLICFPLHSISNCCRVTFDAFGEGAAKLAVLPAALCQLWLLWPALTATFSLQMVMLILVAIDYGQHFVACTYWAAVACGAARASAARARAFYGVCGAVLHMLSVVPLVSFNVATVDTADKPNQWVYVPLVGLAVGLLAYAHMCWIKMALLTPQAVTQAGLVMMYEPRACGRHASPQLPRVALRKTAQGQSEERTPLSSRGIFACGRKVTPSLLELTATSKGSSSFIHTDFSLPQITPDYLPDYPDHLVADPSAPPPPPTPPPAPPPAPLPAGRTTCGEDDVVERTTWWGGRGENDVWAEAQTEQGETYYYHVVTGETAWERHTVL